MSPDLFVVLKLIVLVFALIVSPYPWTGMHRRVHSSKASTFHIIINSGQSQPVVREQTGIVIWVLYSAEQSCVNIENPCVWPCVSRQASCRCVFEPDTKPTNFFLLTNLVIKKKTNKKPFVNLYVKKNKKKKPQIFSHLRGNCTELWPCRAVCFLHPQDSLRMHLIQSL